MWDAQVSGLVGRLPGWLSKIRQFVIFYLVQVNSLYLGFIQVIMSIIQTYWQVRFKPSTDFVALISISDIEGRGRTVLTLQKSHV